METLRLTRVSSSSKYGTFGVLTINGLPECVTLEPYDRNNKTMLSCIPTGVYPVIWYNSTSYGKTLLVGATEGRYGILLHQGNLSKNTNGCILVGRQFGELSSANGILHSMKALKSLLYKLEDKTDIQLIITEAF